MTVAGGRHHGGHVRVDDHAPHLLTPFEANMCVCVCVCVCSWMYVGACVRACMDVCASASAHPCARACTFVSARACAWRVCVRVRASPRGGLIGP